MFQYGLRVEILSRCKYHVRFLGLIDDGGAFKRGLIFNTGKLA